MGPPVSPLRPGRAAGRRLRLLALLATITLVLAGCAGSVHPGRWMDDGRWMDEMHRSMRGGDRDPAGAPSPPAPGATEVMVVGTEFSFAPERPEIPSGRSVNLRLRNNGALSHDLTIEGSGFSLYAGPGETAVALLPQLDPGDYRFFCSIAGHAEAGMTGTLVVIAVPAA